MLTTAVTFRFRGKSEERGEYNVTFNDIDGKELLVCKVRPNAFAVPPENLSLSENQVFIDWGNPLYPVRSDVVCKPSIDDVSDGTNVFFVNTMYIQESKSKHLQMQIGGQVALDRLDIQLQYNSESLKFKSATSTLGNVELVKDGTVRFTLDSTKMLNSPCVLADIECKAVGKAFTYDEFTFNVTTAQIDSTPATYERMKTRVFIYKP